jgi:hypothetical protein
MIKCKICENEMLYVFSHKVIKKHEANYHICKKCGFMNISDPFWLKEAYQQPINETDTGLLKRNIQLHKKVIVLIYTFLDCEKNYLDYAGGYGVFTRLMRDAGFNFFHEDIYTKNIFASSYEFKKSDHLISGITCFECFEHLIDPISEMEKMLAISSNIFLTTDLKPLEIPNKDWAYYGFEHGQHISFYSYESLSNLASRFNLNLYSYKNFHFFTKKVINIRQFKKCLRNAGRLNNIFSSKAWYEKISKKVSLK